MKVPCFLGKPTAPSRSGEGCLKRSEARGRSLDAELEAVGANAKDAKVETAGSSTAPLERKLGDQKEKDKEKEATVGRKPVTRSASKATPVCRLKRLSQLQATERPWEAEMTVFRRK